MGRSGGEDSEERVNHISLVNYTVSSLVLENGVNVYVMNDVVSSGQPRFSTGACSRISRHIRF